MESDIDTIKNNINVDMVKTINDDKPKIKFNCIKRNVLLKEELLALYDHLRKYQRIVMEIYIFKKPNVSFFLFSHLFMFLKLGKQERGFKVNEKSK